MIRNVVNSKHHECMSMLSFWFVEFVNTHTFMIYTSGSTPPRDGGCAESEPAIGDGVGELA